MKVSISINAQHYLDLYTNNIHFEPVKFIKGKPAIYEISTISTKVKINSLEHGDRKKKLEKAVQLMGGDFFLMIRRPPKSKLFPYTTPTLLSNMKSSLTPVTLMA